MSEVTPQTNTLISLWNQNNLINKNLDASLGAIHGIGFSEYMALHQLVNSPNMMLRRIDLASLLGRSASGVTKMLNPMEKIGLVDKQQNPRDARVSLVKITTRGLKTYQHASTSINQASEKLFRHIKKPEVSQLQQLVELIDV